jgi:hypothetical protein
MTWRSVSRIVDRDAHEFEMDSADKSGREENMTAIKYIRKKGVPQ